MYSIVAHYHSKGQIRVPDLINDDEVVDAMLYVLRLWGLPPYAFTIWERGLPSYHIYTDPAIKTVKTL